MVRKKELKEFCEWNEEQVFSQKRTITQLNNEIEELKEQARKDRQAHYDQVGRWGKASTELHSRISWLSVVEGDTIHSLGVTLYHVLAIDPNGEDVRLVVVDAEGCPLGEPSWYKKADVLLPQEEFKWRI